jgi:hypothetical protein
MNKIELAASEEIVVDVTEELATELSLSELEMIGGGGWSCLLM